MLYRKFGTTEAEISEIGYRCLGHRRQTMAGRQDDQSLLRIETIVRTGRQFCRYGAGLRRWPQRATGRAGGRTDRSARSTSRPRFPRKIAFGRPRPRLPISQVFPYDYIVRCTEESLRNLGLEQIYLQQFHVWTDAWVDTENGVARSKISRQRKSPLFRGFSHRARSEFGAEAVKTGCSKPSR